VVRFGVDGSAERRGGVELWIGDDWAQDKHDVAVLDASGRLLRKGTVAEGAAGMEAFATLLAEVVGEEELVPAQIRIGIETDRGPWVNALVMLGFQVFVINPRQVARYREQLSMSGAKSDAADARALADMVRLHGETLRPITGDSAQVQAVAVTARAHQTLVWERTRQCQRLRANLREYFPAALAAFPDLHATDTLALLAKAPDPERAARLSQAKIAAALKAARRHRVADKAVAIQSVLRAGRLVMPTEVEAAMASVTVSLVAIIAVLNAQIAVLAEQLDKDFGKHPDAEIYLSQPGLGPVLAPRVLAEFGDDRSRFADAKARKNYAGTSPITRASGKSRVVLARWVGNRRLVDAVHQQALCALTASPGARAYYDALRARKIGHHAALRQLGNRLVGILHGCLKTRTLYNEATAWPAQQAVA
jgi:transposase